MRSTRQRELILEAVRSTLAHPTADWVYRQVQRKVPRISLGTVYRNLKLLAETGRIAEIRQGKHPSRYEAALERHYHIRCVRCGRLEDLAMEPRRRLEREAARISRYQVLDHTVDVIGVCPVCRLRRPAVLRPGRAAPGGRTSQPVYPHKKEKADGESRSSSRRAGGHQR